MGITVPNPDLNLIAKKAEMSGTELGKFLDLIRRAMTPEMRRIPVTEKGERRYYSVERRGVGVLNTKHGKLWEYSFEIDDQWRKYSVIVSGDIDEDRLIPVFRQRNSLILRTDSGCETGQIYGDLTCECREQLDLAMKMIAEAGEGVIVCIPRQDGRGMGVPFKLATLWLQDKLGVNTVESAGLLAPDGVIDVRTYAGVICILQFFGIDIGCAINLATNNPEKARVFAENGYTVGDFTPVVIEPTPLTIGHLRAKQDHMGHNSLVNKGE